MTKERNMTVGYHGGHLQIIPPFFKVPKIIHKQHVENLLVWNKRSKITPFLLLIHYHIRHV